jgi:outer membrane protein
MKRIFVLACAVFCIVLAAGAAAADGINGRLGVTGRIGFLVPSDNDIAAPFSDLDSDIGFIGGGGFIYGIGKNFAAELDITHTEFDSNRGSSRVLSFETNNISFGAQYRFVDLPIKQLVPYLGAGVDILFNEADDSSGSHVDVDTVAGVHLTGGVDYFIMKQLALTSEVKGVIAPDADIKRGDIKIGDYDPTSISMTFGIRYFFN